MSTVQWKADALVTLKLRDDLYTIAQLKAGAYMWCFDIRSTAGEWDGIDLNNVKPLFCVLVGQVVMQRLAVSKIKMGAIPPTDLPIPSLWLNPNTNAERKIGPSDMENFLWRNAKLIDLDPKLGYVKSPVIKPSLDIVKDRELIESCELTNMWGDVSLRDRLCRYFDTGINRDDLKFAIFPGLWNDMEQLRPLTRRLPLPEFTQ